MQWNPNNGVRHTRGSYFGAFISTYHQFINRSVPRAPSRMSRALLDALGKEGRRARCALVNPISLVSTIALSGGKSRKLLGISRSVGLYSESSQVTKSDRTKCFHVSVVLCSPQIENRATNSHLRLFATSLFLRRPGGTRSVLFFVKFIAS